MKTKKFLITACVVLSVSFVISDQLIAQNIGIGTNAPIYKLHLVGGDIGIRDSYPFIIMNDTAGNGNTGLSFREQGQYKGWLYYSNANNFLRINAEPGNGYRNDIVIKDNGYVGIGTSAPAYRLHVYNGQMEIKSYMPFLHFNDTSSTGNCGIAFRHNGTAVGWIYYNNAGHYLRINAEEGNGYRNDLVISQYGDVGIGIGTPSSALTINHATGLTDGLRILNSYDSDSWRWTVGQTSNTLYLYFNDVQRGTYSSTTGVYTASSDRRMKTGIEDMQPVLGQVLGLPLRQYYFIADTVRSQKSFGVIAQEIRDIFPSLVYYAEEADFYTVDYGGFGILAIKAIQEQQEIIDAQQKWIEELSGEMDELLKRVKVLEGNE